MVNAVRAFIRTNSRTAHAKKKLCERVRELRSFMSSRVDVLRAAPASFTYCQCVRVYTSTSNSAALEPFCQFIFPLTSGQ